MANVNVKLVKGLKGYRLRGQNYKAGLTYEVDQELASALMSTGKFQTVVNVKRDNDAGTRGKVKKKATKKAKRVVEDEDEDEDLDDEEDEDEDEAPKVKKKGKKVKKGKKKKKKKTKDEGEGYEV